MPRAPRNHTKQESKPMAEQQKPEPVAPAPKTYSAEEVEKMIAAASEKQQAALLAKLGAKNPDELVQAVGKFREAEESRKTELEKLMERTTKAEGEAGAAKLYRDRLAAIMQRELESLTPAQRAAVEKFGGDDPLKAADALDFLRPTWQSAATPAGPVGETPSVAPAAPPTKPAPPAPANAALPTNAPPPAAVRTKWEEFDAIKNPIAKNVFYATHSKEIEDSRPAPAAN